MLNNQRTIAPKAKICSKGALWRNAAIAAITTASLLLPTMSVAQPREGGQETAGGVMHRKRHVVKHKLIYNATQTPSTTSRLTYGASPDTAYHSYFTLPPDDPAFYGGG
jgi:hypothetical protein